MRSLSYPRRDGKNHSSVFLLQNAKKKALYINSFVCLETGAEYIKYNGALVIPKGSTINWKCQKKVLEISFFDCGTIKVQKLNRTFH